ncbi:MAG: KH domain-containing protein [Solirubrobacteraceae bacterium]|nr:KH domain-containing protein [Solirubrobacteraceae bacterium]
MSDAAAARTMLETVVRPLVGNPDAISISESAGGDEGPVVLELSLDPGDYGRVIGRGGRTANAVRQLVRAAAVRDGRRVLVDIVQ